MQVNYTHLIYESRASEYWNTKLGERAASLAGIKWDLQAVHSTARRLQDELVAHGTRDRILTESLTWHVIMRYARCFDSDSDGRRANLTKVQLRGFAEDFLTLHEGLIERRNRTFAHAGNHCSHRTIVHLMSPQADDDSVLAVTSDVESPGAISDPDQAGLIAQLSYNLIPVVDRLSADARAALIKEIVADKEVANRLKAVEGRHANPQQAAIAVMARLERKGQS